MTFLSQRQWQELLDASATSSNDGRSRRAQNEMRMRARQFCASGRPEGSGWGLVARNRATRTCDCWRPDLIFLVPQLRRMSLLRFDGRVALITGAGRGKRISAANQKPPRHAPFSLMSVPVQDLVECMLCCWPNVGPRSLVSSMHAHKYERTQYFPCTNASRYIRSACRIRSTNPTSSYANLSCCTHCGRCVLNPSSVCVWPGL